MVDTSSTIVHVNSRVQNLLGYDPANLIGRSLLTIIPRRYHNQHETGMKRFVATGQSHVVDRQLAVEATRRDGVEVPVSLMIAAIPEKENWLFYGTLRRRTLPASGLGSDL